MSCISVFELEKYMLCCKDFKCERLKKKPPVFTAFEQYLSDVVDIQWP